MNSELVSLYASGMHPDDLYKRYYNNSPPARLNKLSQWEVEMKSFIQTMSKSQ